MLGTVVGWGRTEEGGALPAVIQEVQVPILTLAQCRSSKYRASRITANMLCAGKGTQDSCQVTFQLHQSTFFLANTKKKPFYSRVVVASVLHTDIPLH